jgi:hypothetical protein
MLDSARGPRRGCCGSILSFPPWLCLVAWPSWGPILGGTSAMLQSADVADQAPNSKVLTDYDEQHMA